MPLTRTFSFEDNDEQILSSNEQERLNYQYHQHHSPYRDSPNRDIVSPPPRYYSPPPREDTISPPSPLPSPPYHTPVYSAQLTRDYNAPRDVPPRRALPTRHSVDSAEVPPPPPPHGASPTRSARYQDSELAAPQALRPPLVTPGRENFGDMVEGGGIGRLAQGMANGNGRESDVEALRALERSSPTRSYYPEQRDPYSSPDTFHRPIRLQERSSYASTMPLTAGADTPGTITPRASPDPRGMPYPGRNIHLDDYPSHAPFSNYQDSPYQNSALDRNAALTEASIDPYNIADDGDDGFLPDPKKKSMRDRMSQGAGPGARLASGSALGGLFSRKANAQKSSGSYDPVRQTGHAGSSEKSPRSEWLARQTKGNNKMRWVVGGAIVGVVLLATIAGIVGGVVYSKKSNSGSGSSSGSGSVDPNSNDNNAVQDLKINGDLNKNSPQIEALLNNQNLHKVFPGIDYTPWGTQYPLCYTYPPSPNNVTRDMAVLSQLTNAVRLYGTDCNQTQMVLHSIDQLELTDMKIWLGVWIDTNQTTTDRQLAQMYDILANEQQAKGNLNVFKGAIVGNEALYRAGLDKASSAQQLVDILAGVKQKFTELGYDLPLSTSDLGDNWPLFPSLVDSVDMVLSNIHPFFAGVAVSSAAAWTLNFWEVNDKPLTAGTSKQQIISETGWPTGGGRDCGGSTGDCTDAQMTSDDVAIASVSGLNQYMDEWVCQALENGTEYFWFEAFDEPWKVVYNTPGKEWEDKWGLMDSGRNLKDGVKIPDCGGRTVGS